MRRMHLKTARLAAGLSAIELGENIGISEQRIFDIERGRYLPKPAEAHKWAGVLCINPEFAFPEMFKDEASREC